MIKTTLILFLLSLAVIGCRKEIEVPTPSNDPLPISDKWVRITPTDITDVRAISDFSNRIFIGGGFNNNALGVDYLCQIDKETNAILPLDIPASFGSEVNTLIRDNYVMMVGGEFNTPGTGINGRSALLTMDHNLDFTVSPLGHNLNERVEHLIRYQGDFWACGNFLQDSYNLANHVVEFNSSYNQIANNYNNNGELLEIAKPLSGLYAINSNRQLVKLTNGSFQQVNYPGATASDKIYAIAEYDDDLYVFGKFWNGDCIKVLAGSTIWSEVGEVEHFGTANDNFRFKEITGGLYLMGNNFSINGSKVSSVVRYNEYEYEWQTLGNLGVEARDIIYSSGLYLATENGVYVYED